MRGSCDGDGGDIEFLSYGLIELRATSRELPATLRARPSSTVPISPPAHLPTCPTAHQFPHE